MIWRNNFYTKDIVEAALKRFELTASDIRKIPNFGEYLTDVSDGDVLSGFFEKSYGERRNLITQSISYYNNTNPLHGDDSEVIGEAFADYYANTDNAVSLSVQIIEELKERVKNVNGKS